VTEVERARLGALLGHPAAIDPDLAAVVTYWGKLPPHIRATIRILLLAVRETVPATGRDDSDLPD